MNYGLVDREANVNSEGIGVGGGIGQGPDGYRPRGNVIGLIKGGS